MVPLYHLYDLSNNFFESSFLMKIRFVILNNYRKKFRFCNLSGFFLQLQSIDQKSIFQL